MTFVTHDNIEQIVEYFGAVLVHIHLADTPSYSIAAQQAKQYLSERGIKFGIVDTSRGCIRGVVFTRDALPPVAAEWARSYEIPSATPQAQD